MEKIDDIPVKCMRLLGGDMVTGTGTSWDPYILRSSSAWRFPTGACVVAYRSLVSGTGLTVSAVECALNVDTSDVHGLRNLVAGNRNTVLAPLCVIVGKQNVAEDRRRLHEVEASVVPVGVRECLLGPGEGDWHDASECLVDDLPSPKGVLTFLFGRRVPNDDKYRNIVTRAGSQYKGATIHKIHPRARVRVSTTGLQTEFERLEQENKARLAELKATQLFEPPKRPPMPSRTPGPVT